MIAVEYHRDLKEVQSDAGLAALLSADVQRAPFDRLAWWQGLADHCGLDPLLAVARQGDAAAVLPLQRVNGRLAGLANWYSFRLRPVASPQADAAALLTALARDLARRAPRVTLSGLPDEDGSAGLTEAAFRKAGWIALREPCDTNHVLRLAGRSYDEYLAGRPGPLRTTLKRKSGKVEVRLFNRFDDEAWNDYEEIYGESWKPSEGSPDFLRAFARAEGAAGRLRLGLARAEGRAVAAQMWTVEGGTAFIHKLAHREDAKPLSPGTVLSAALFRRVIDEDRVALIDFGTGNDGYKRDWMEEVRPRYRLDLLRAEAPANWPFLARRALKRLAGNVRLAKARRYSRLPQREAPNTPMQTQTDQLLRRILTDVLGLKPGQADGFTTDTGLFGHLPELDSMAVAGLLTEMEDRLDIMIEDDEIDGELLESYGSLLAFAEAKRAA